MTQVSLVPILLWVAALAATCIAVWRGPRPVARAFVIDRLLRYLFVFWGCGPLSATSSSRRNRRHRSAGQQPVPIRGGRRRSRDWTCFGLRCVQGLRGAACGFARGRRFPDGRRRPPRHRYRDGGEFRSGQRRTDPHHRFSHPHRRALLLFLSSDEPAPKSTATVALEAELEVARKAMREYRNALSELGKD